MIKSTESNCRRRRQDKKMIRRRKTKIQTIRTQITTYWWNKRKNEDKLNWMLQDMKQQDDLDMET